MDVLFLILARNIYEWTSLVGGISSYCYNILLICEKYATVTITFLPQDTPLHSNLLAEDGSRSAHSRNFPCWRLRSPAPSPRTSAEVYTPATHAMNVRENSIRDCFAYTLIAMVHPLIFSKMKFSILCILHTIYMCVYKARCFPHRRYQQNHMVVRRSAWTAACFSGHLYNKISTVSLACCNHAD